MFDREQELDPWRVILSCLFEKVGSYDIPQIIDKAGLPVDWSLTERQDYSHGYRKAAYRPRINKAYEALSREHRLRVAYIVAEELTHRDYTTELDTALRRIDWCTESERLAPADAAVRELFFPRDSQHDAYVAIRQVLQKARTSIKVIDPYLDGSIFTVVGRVSAAALQVQLLTSKVPNDFIHEARKFLQQHKNFKIDIRRTKDFHDRFIMIDDRECWHLGCSIKDAGSKVFMMSQIEDQKHRASLTATLSKTWSSADRIFPCLS